MLRSEQIAGATPHDRLRGAVQRARDGLWAEVTLGSPLLASVGLVAAALALQTAAFSSPGHFRPATVGIYAVLVCGETALALCLCFVATLDLRRAASVRLRQVLGALALVVLVGLSLMGTARGLRSAQLWVGGSTYSNDGAVMDLYAAQQVLRGRNPYAQQNIVTALAAINAPSTTTTPLMDGQFRGAQAYPSPEAVQQVFLNVLLHRPRTIPSEFESKYNYPSGSFLFILPFVWSGIHDMRFLYVLAVIAMGAYLWRRLPRALRLLAPLVVLANVPLVEMTLGGQPDPVYGLFLLVGLAEWPRRWVSSVAMGLAIATKQLAWFILPFYLVYIGHTRGWREAARRGAMVVALFAALNGPFILRAPGAYLSSISGPMADPMFPLGIGLVALFVSGVLPMLPKLAFTVLELLVWGGSIAAASRARRVALAGSAVLACLPLFFAYRSLASYFYLAPLLALAVVLADSERGVAATRAARP